MKNKNEMMAEINITPLTDVMMVLLIIFIVTAAAYTQIGFNLKLPAASSSQKVAASEVTIFLAENGAIFLGSHQVSQPELKKQLKKLKQKSYQTAVVNGDKKVSYGKVIALLDTVRNCGFSDIALATEGGEPKF